MQPELLVSWVSRLGLVELSHTWLLPEDVHHQPCLFQPRGQCLSPRCHLPAQAVLPHPGVCCGPGDVFWPPLSQSRAGPVPLLLGFRHSRAGRGRDAGHQQRAGAAPSAAQHSPGRHCQPDLTPCPGSQLHPLFLLALADFLAAAVLLSTATIQLLPAPLFIPAYAACPYGLMLATVSGAARTRPGLMGPVHLLLYCWERNKTPLWETPLWAGASLGKSRAGRHCSYQELSPLPLCLS